jgi:hypothetical protein
MKNYYEELGIKKSPEKVLPSDIDAGYRLSAKHDPLVKKAYATLMNQTSRQAYDRFLKDFFTILIDPSAGWQKFVQDNAAEHGTYMLVQAQNEIRYDIIAFIVNLPQLDSKNVDDVDAAETLTLIRVPHTRPYVEARSPQKNDTAEYDRSAPSFSNSFPSMASEREDTAVALLEIKPTINELQSESFWTRLFDQWERTDRLAFVEQYPAYRGQIRNVADAKGDQMVINIIDDYDEKGKKHTQHSQPIENHSSIVPSLSLPLPLPTKGNDKLEPPSLSARIKKVREIMERALEVGNNAELNAYAENVTWFNYLRNQNNPDSYAKRREHLSQSDKLADDISRHPAYSLKQKRSFYILHHVATQSTDILKRVLDMEQLDEPKERVLLDICQELAVSLGKDQALETLRQYSLASSKITPVPRENIQPMNERSKSKSSNSR